MCSTYQSGSPPSILKERKRGFVRQRRRPEHAEKHVFGGARVIRFNDEQRSPGKARILDQIGLRPRGHLRGRVIGFYCLHFLTDVVRVDPALAATVLLVSRIYDAITDPFEGILTDRARTRWGPGP